MTNKTKSFKKESQRKPRTLMMLSIDPSKAKEIKQFAKMAGMTLSDFVTTSACEVGPSIVANSIKINKSLLDKYLQQQKRRPIGK